MSNAPEQWNEIMQHIKKGDPDIQGLAETVIMAMANAESTIQWICGDVLVRTDMSDKTVNLWCQLLNKKQGAINSYYNTARRFPAEDDNGQRWQIIADNPSLTFSHFKECAPLVDSNGIDYAVGLLQEAGAEQWTRASLVREIKVRSGKTYKKPKQVIARGSIIIHPDGTRHITEIRSDVPLDAMEYDITIYRKDMPDE